jgi:Mg-chelatase subunit ChlD
MGANRVVQKSKEAKMKAAMAGGRSAGSFHHSVRVASSSLPPPSSITYTGLFNEHSYCVGEPERNAAVAIHACSAWAKDVDWDSRDSKSSEVFVACFLKSCRDGQPRDATPIDLVVVLDVSGSMNRIETVAGQSRLDLAKHALQALFPRLRSDDRFGLATFNNQGKAVQTLDFVSNLEATTINSKIHALQAQGGTTMVAGMNAAVQILGSACASPSAMGCRHRRLLFLTDMDDVNPGQLKEMIAEQAKLGLYASFVGIGGGFNCQLAEEATKHPGANYLCIAKPEDIHKVVVSHFDWNYFPAAFDVELACESDCFELAAAYGTPYDTKEEVLRTRWHPDIHYL